MKLSLTDVFLYFRQKEMRSLVRFISGLQHNISRLVVVVFDAIMRIRTRTGVRLLWRFLHGKHYSFRASERWWRGP